MYDVDLEPAWLDEAVSAFLEDLLTEAPSMYAASADDGTVIFLYARGGNIYAVALYPDGGAAVLT